MTIFFKRILLLAFLICLTSCSTFNDGPSCAPEKMKLTETNFKVDISVYKSDSTSVKSIIIFPPTGGTNLIDRSYAKQFCQAGFHVSVINGWTDDQETKSDLEIHQHFYSGAQRAIQVVHAEIKTPYVGLIGTSVGALHAAIAASTIPKLNAVFLILGGAPISEVIVTSDQKAMRDLKSVRQKRFSFKNDLENIKAIDHAFSLEPMSQGRISNSKDIGMIIASRDETVPTKNQLKLKEFFKPKTVVTLNNDHFWGIVKAWLLHSQEVLKFFNDSVAKQQASEVKI